MRFICSMLFSLLIPFAAHAEKTIEITGNIGVTSVNLDELVKKDEVANTAVDDWDQTASGIGAQVFFTTIGSVSVGAELMYQYLYWYQVRIPYVPSPIYRDYGVSTMRVAPVFRFGTRALSFDVGPELNFLGGGTLGVMASGNVYIPLSKTLDIPIKLRIDAFNNIVPTVAATANVGLRYRFE